MNQLDEIFKMFYYAVCGAAKYIFAIKMATGILKDGNNSDIEGVIKNLMYGGANYACLYAIMGVLDAIQGKFQ